MTTAFGPATTSEATTRSRVPLMIGCLQALILANLVQVAAGLAGLDLSPPPEMLPAIASTAALGIAALAMVRARMRLGYQLGIAFCFVSMVGMGPHKLFLDDGAAIAPMALVGFLFEVLFIAAAVRELGGGR